MIRILWLELKNYLKDNKLVFVLSALAFTCSCVAINLTMWNFLLASAEQNAYEESYGDKVFYKITMEGETEVYQRVFGDNYIEQVKAAFEQLKSDPLFQYKYRINDGGLQFFDHLDSSYGTEDFPSYKRGFVAEDAGTGADTAAGENDLSLKAIYSDRLLIEEPGVSLARGHWFSDEDYYVDDPADIQLPVVLGSDYEDLYAIGDTLGNAHYGTVNPITLRVIGFLKPDSTYYDNNNEKQIMNQYMVLPAPEAAYSPFIEDGSVDEFFKACYDSFKLVNARIICDKERAAAVLKRVYQIFNENKLYELKLNDETAAAQRGLEEASSLTVSSMAISLFTLLLSIFMSFIQARYKLNKYKKKYGIYRMCGITAKQLLLVMMLDMVLLFSLSNLLTAVIYSVIGFMTVSVSIYTVVMILALELVLLGFMGLSGYIKVHRTDMSSALREHE